jgi:hypothetical protein
MRIIDTIPHPQLKISIFQMNGKYLVKFEAGSYEQTFKVDESEVSGLVGLKEKVNDEFLVEVAAAFRIMHAANPWKE